MRKKEVAEGFSLECLSTDNLKSGVDENREYFDPPFRTNKLLVQKKDFLVMILHGPNKRLDFHIEPGDEFFYQLEGKMELHLKPEGERRQIVTIGEVDIFVCLGEMPHSPRRFADTWGLVIERQRRAQEKEKFAWFCEECDGLVLSRTVNQGNIPAQVKAIYQEFNEQESLRTCRACGYVFPQTPVAERLQFLSGSK